MNDKNPSKKEITNISFKTLSKLGMLDIVKKQTMKHQLISSIKSPSEEIKNKLIRNWIEEKGIESEEALEIWMENNGGLNENELFELISFDWKWREWCIKKFRDEISSYFLRKKSDLDTVSYSLIRVKNIGLANELFLRIKDEKESFYKIATEFSEGIEKETGGKIGPIPLGQSHPLIYEKLKKSSIKKLWAPFKIDEWWIILKLEQINSKVLDESLKLDLSLELGEKYLNKINKFQQYK